MNRIHLVAIAACSAALGIVGCRSQDRVSETNITSAPAPVEPAMNADAPNVASVPVEEARDGGHGEQSQVGHSGHAAYDTAGDDARDAGSSALADFAAIKDAGAASVDETNAKASKSKPTRASAKDAGSTVAPGHIMFPPETTGRATGSPNSNGSHDVGAGGALVR